MIQDFTSIREVSKALGLNYDDDFCPMCDGSGEGRADGEQCFMCNGTGSRAYMASKEALAEMRAELAMEIEKEQSK